MVKGTQAACHPSAEALIVGVDILEQFDELDALVPILGMRKDMARVEINAGQNGDRAVTNVLVVAPYRCRFSRSRRQIRGRQAQYLNTRFFVDADRV